jgi:hypothetical protein
MGKKSSKTTTKSEPWKPAQGAILDAINTTQDTVNANQGNLNDIASGIQGYLPGLGQQAFGQNPTLGAANGYAQDVLGGKYLNANPYMDQMINSTANDVQDRVNSLFGNSGASLGTQHAGVLGRELSNAENTMRYQNYAQERQNQQQAASMVPALYGSQFAGVTPYLAAAQTAGTLPYAGVSALSPIMGLAAQGGQQSGTQPGGWGNDLMNAAASIGSAAIMASDRRLKTNIVLEHRDPDGLGWYSWNWRADPKGEPVRGVIADEVEKLRPWAFVKGFVNGVYDGVNYSALGGAA